MNGNTIGENVARNRKKLGMTQEELAEKMNVSGQAVSKWENDLSYPDVETLKRLACLFACTLDELVNGAPAAPTIKSAEPEQVDRRTLTVKVEAGAESKIHVRFPVALIKRAAESGKLEQLLGKEAGFVHQILPMILEGAVGELVNVEQNGSKVTVEVEDYAG